MGAWFSFGVLGARFRHRPHDSLIRVQNRAFSVVALSLRREGL